MVSRSQIKLITSLAHKKYRKNHQLFVAEGAKIASETLQSQLEAVNVFAVEGWLSSNADMIYGLSKESIYTVTEQEMGQISHLSSPSPVLILLKLPDYKFTHPLQGINLCLEGIRDPGNLGTIIRLADWYGLDKIYCSDDCVDAYSPKVVQATMGSISRVKIHYVLSLPEMISSISMPAYAAVLNSDWSIHEIKSVETNCLILIGNESQGLSQPTLNSAGHTICIPRFGQAESLNAATATAIILDNFMRVIASMK